MGDSLYILLGITYFILATGLIFLTIFLINKHQHKKYSEMLNGLEKDKNLIISASILTELNKVETLINNDKMKEMYDNFQKRFKEIKDVLVPSITDELIEVEDLLQTKKYKKLDEKLAKIELNVYYIKMKSNYLLSEIREITLSEEKNRETVTKLKKSYREIFTKYNQSQKKYEGVNVPIELQFETVDKLFSAFEVAMENKSLTEISKIVKAMDDTIGNLKMVIEEAPTIIVMGKTIIPKKIGELNTFHKRMTKDGYNLDFLNFDYNVKEAEKKIADIFDRLNVLNIEDSIFDLKTMLDYFDSLYNDFDKEKNCKKIFEEYSRTIIIKAKKLDRIANNLFAKIDDIKYSYDLSDDDVQIINIISEELKSILNDHEIIMGSYRNKTFAFSKLSKEMELLNVRLSKTEDTLESALRKLGSLKEDELRAHEQLDDIKNILKQAKEKMNSYKLPMIPQNYYVELEEATEAIGEIIKEIEKKPISIKTLNTRVDTARDLVLKIYNTSNEVVKTAWMAEMAIVYGNRYRPVNKEIEIGLIKAENFFNKGNFRSSLECAINAINLIEPGVHKRLLESYKN